MLTRRELVRLGLLGSGAMLMPEGHLLTPVRSSFADDYDDAPTSPRTTPFVDPLPVPPLALEVEPFLDFPADYTHYVGPSTRFFRVVAEERAVRFHRDLPDTLIWGYRDDNPLGPYAFKPWPFALGPTFADVHGFNALGGGMLVRHVNALPADHRGFGVPITSVHLHGGHHLARADGFPTNIDGFPPFVTEPGGHFDHCYPVLDPGFLDYYEGRSKKLPDVTERPSTLWYHDHLIDFTAANVYRGLAGFTLMFDELDSGDETDPNAEALRLPSFPFDVPLVLQDKRFNADGSLWFDTFDHDGFLGDKSLVNGVIQPFLEVQRRKYRFRVLNGSNARIYQFFLANSLRQTFPMTQIATEGGLLSRPIPNVQSFLISPAERVEFVVDFASPMFDGQQTLYLENRLEQDDGRKPDGLTSRGVQLMRFNIVGGTVEDPSRVGKLENGETYLRHFERVPQADLDRAVRRTFEFERSGGAWVINDRLAGDLDRAMVEAELGVPQIWRLVNKSGGWWHPIHIHSEFSRVLRRNGSTPPLAEQDGVGKKDTILLKDNETAEVFLQFRDYTGPFVFHCHNLEHEDMAMMARFDVV